MNAIEPPTPIGWIGTGVMGASMCGHLLARGYPVTVYNRTPAKTEQLTAAGAQWADSPRKVAEQSQVIFTIVGFPHDIRDVILSDQGVLAGSRPGNIVVDMTTSEPSLAVEISQRAAELGVESVDAPVSGGDVGAREARLSIMVGGNRPTVGRLMPLFEAMGQTIVYQGPAGSGQHTKMVNQILIATNMIGVCEALLYAQQAGLDLVTVMESVASGAAGSWSLSNYGPRIMQGDFAPGFYVEHFIKDLGIALSESKRMQLNLPGLKLAWQLYEELASMGHARSGTHALQLALAGLSGLEWKTGGTS